MGYRKFKPEFKRRVVEEWVSAGKRIAEVCRKYKLSDSLVRRWRKEYERKGPGAWEMASETNDGLPAAEQRIAEREAAFGRAKREVPYPARPFRAHRRRSRWRGAAARPAVDSSAR